MNTLHADDFAALNDEIRALTRAGVSLPSSLRAVGAEYSGRIGAVAQLIAERIERGESLADAMVAECGLPSAYAAVVAAGVRSGHLASAMEGIATTSRRISDLRRLILVSLAYPILLVAMAYGLMVFLLADPNQLLVTDVYSDFGLGESPFGFYRTLQQTLPYWVAWPPLVMAALLGWAFYSLGRSNSFSLFGRRTGIANLIASSRTTAFLDLLSLLIDSDNPLDESVRLAAEASGDRVIAATGSALADRIEMGHQSADESIDGASTRAIPPMVQWVLTSKCSKGQLLKSLRRSADAYRRRTQRAGEGMSIYIPLLFCGTIGGTATVALGLFVLGPWFHLLVRLGASI